VGDRAEKEERMKLRRFESINVVPFIDIMLVLLVIVLTTATFVAKGIIPVDLAQAASSEAMKPEKDLVITIQKDGSYFFDDQAVEVAVMDERLNTYDAQTNIMINADKQTLFEPFVFLMDRLKEHGFKRVGIVTKR
jgi:biopolymer transport protein ExbD